MSYHVEALIDIVKLYLSETPGYRRVVKMANGSTNDFSSSMEIKSSPTVIVIINCALNAPLILISTISNTLVLAAILRSPSLRSASIVLLCSLAFSDLLVGLFVQPAYIACEITDVPLLCRLMKTAAFFAGGVSLLTITAITLDRFLALRYHMRYPNMVTTNRALCASAAVWFTCVLLSFSTFWSHRFYYTAIAVTIVVCLLMCTACYIRIYRVVCRHQLEIHAQAHALQSNNVGNRQRMQRTRKSAKNTFIYFITMIVCYVPMFVTMFVLSTYPDLWTRAWNLTDTVAFMNSSINPILYCWRLQELRTAVVKAAKLVFCKRT